MSGKVIKIIDKYEFVINVGTENGVKEKDKFILFNLGEEIKDKETGENLGQLEILCGHVVAKHVQTKMTTVVSDEYSYKTIRKRNSFLSIDPFYPDLNEETESTMKSIENVETYKTLCRKIN